jgi:hypothetical protein
MRRLRLSMSFIGLALLGSIATGCAGEIAVPDMAKVASPVRDVGQFNGTYRNVANEPPKTMGHALTLWQLLTREPDNNARSEHLVRIESRNNGSLLVALIVEGEERERREIATRLKEGYLLSGTKLDVYQRWGGLEIVDDSCGLGVDRNGDLLVLWHSGGSLLFPPLGGGPSVGQVVSTFARRNEGPRAKNYVR